MSMLNCARLAWKYRRHWKLLSLSDSVPLKVSEMRTLVLFVLVLGLEVWLGLRVLVSWPNTLASCSLVLLLQQGLDHERVEDVGLLAVLLLVIGLVGASSQLWLLSAGMILGPGIGKTVRLCWIVLEGDLGDEQSLWWIRLERYGVFGG